MSSCEYYDEEEGEYSSTWVDEFCDNYGDWFVRVPDEFIEDGFNLYGLDSIENIQDFHAIVHYLTCNDPSDYDDIDYEDVLKVYCLIHARYIMSPAGIDDMIDKYEKGCFGVCPRLECNQQNVIPFGVSSKLDQGQIYVYCPCCKDIYYPSNNDMKDFDGAAYGPSFAPFFESILLSEHFQIEECRNIKMNLMGFDVHPSSFRRLDRENNN